MIDPHYVVASINFEPDGVAITYMHRPNDLRDHIVLSHQIVLSAEHPDYGEDADSLQRKAVRMVRNALEDFANSQPYDPDATDDEDDEKGMGE